jgi:hypothetical protein
MTKLTQEQVLGIARHALSAIGAILLFKGKVDVSTWDIVTGSLISVTAIIWSVTSKNK